MPESRMTDEARKVAQDSVAQLECLSRRMQASWLRESELSSCFDASLVIVLTLLTARLTAQAHIKAGS
jgi:hypothetical protein